MDGYGNIIYVDEAVSTNSFVYIEEFGSTSSLGVRALARAYFADGSSEEIDVNKVDSEDSQRVIANYTGDTHEKWYTYTENSNGTFNLSSVSGRRSYDYAWNNATSGKDITIVNNDKVQFLSNMNKTGVYGDEDTIFVLLDTDDTLTAYTGITNAPEVILKDGVTANQAKVAWVADKDGYAQYVFIDLNGLDKDQVIVNDSSDESLLFVLKQNASNNKTVVDGATYYQYTVIDTDGTINTAKYIDSASILEPGKLYTNIRENGDGYVTGGDEVMSATSNDQEKYPMDGTTTMTQSGRTLVFTNGAGQYVAPTDADLNLIVGKGVADLLKDDDADYETYLHTTPGTIGGLLVGWSLTGTVYAVVDEQGNKRKLKQKED